MTPAARYRCGHCGEWIYRTGREWTHEHRDEPACIVESRYTGTQAEPANTGPREA